MGDERLTNETPQQMIARLKSELQPEIPSCLPDPDGSSLFESDSRAVDGGLDIEPRLRRPAATADAAVEQAPAECGSTVEPTIDNQTQIEGQEPIGPEDPETPKPKGRIRRMLPKGIFGDGGDWYEIPEDQRKKTYNRLVIGGALGLAVVGIAIVVYLQVMAAVVPDLVGLTSSQAVDAINDAGLVVGSIEEREIPGVEPGVVVDQHPDVDTQTTKGAEVSITVSKAGASVAVPNLVGSEGAQASATLTAARLTAQLVTVYSPTVPAGEVVSQVPAAQTVIDAGSSVAVLVSGGSPSQPKAVPRVLGLTEQAARDILTAAGFVPYVYTARTDLGAAGQIVAQIPGTGEQALPGAAVQVLVNRAVTTDETEVPTVAGLAQAAATAKLTTEGMTAEVVPAASESVAAGLVIAQMPLAERCSVTAGERVGILVSVGTSSGVNTPEVVGKTLADAIAAVRASSLTPIVVLGPAGTEPPSSATVTQQYPAVGAVTWLGTPVVIYATQQ